MSLSYVSTGKVTKAARDAILAEASGIERDWWCESFVFFDDPKAKGKLVGDTKLMLLGYSGAKGKYVEVDPEDDTFMAARDASFLVAQLAKWSKAHGVNWLVEETEMGLPGKITDGKPDADARKLVEALETMFDDEPLTEAKADARASKILKKHKARNA
jgi:hypothetical protein